jgi:hypothetical protein
MTSAQRDVDAVNEYASIFTCFPHSFHNIQSRYVVHHVIDTLRREMQADEINTAPLDELKRLWRLKM